MGEDLHAVEISADHEDLVAALAAADLPTDDLTEPGRRFFAFSEGGRVIGYAGWEEAGDAILLRSLVVLEAVRGRGHGRHITDWLLRRLAAEGRSGIYFLTTSPAAVALGERTGFARLNRGAAPASIRATRQFSSLCPKTAVLMGRRAATR